MRRWARFLVRATGSVVLAVCVLGNADDAANQGGCDGLFNILKSADQICRDTGGSWSENRCQCPSERPNWANGTGCFDGDRQCRGNGGCPGGYVCSQGKCVVGGCSDECSYQNERKCEDTGRSSEYRACGQFDDDPCVEWSSSTSTCPGDGLCVDGRCNILDNGDFERGEGTPDSWTTGAWGQQYNAWGWESNGGRNGSRAVSVNISAAGDAWWQQRVELEPLAPYTLSGWIRGQSIAKGQYLSGDDKGEVGATLSLVGTWSHTDATNMQGTYDWKPVVLSFLSDAIGTAQIGCRLGYWYSSVTGRAFFDDLVLSGDDFATTGSEHVILHLEHKDIASIDEAKLMRWLGHLDRAYEAYHELVGDTPFGGERIHVLSVRHYPGGWAVAGNPIQWMQAFVHESLVKVSGQDDWSFGILHEIGHDFDLQDRWNFHAEFFANLKMYYVLLDLNGLVVVGDKLRRGSELKDYYKGRYDEAQAQGKLDWGDCMVYRFIRIGEQIGWEPFQRTFRFFNGLSGAPSTRTERFNLFVSKLAEYSGADVRGMFTASELSWIAADLAKP